MGMLEIVVKGERASERQAGPMSSLRRPNRPGRRGKKRKDLSEAQGMGREALSTSRAPGAAFGRMLSDAAQAVEVGIRVVCQDLGEAKVEIESIAYRLIIEGQRRAIAQPIAVRPAFP